MGMGEMAAGLSKMRALAKLLTGLAEVLPTVLWDKNNPDFGVRRMTESELSLLVSLIREEDLAGWTLRHLADIVSVLGETPTLTQAPSSTKNTQAASVDDAQLLRSKPPENEKMELASVAGSTAGDRNTVSVSGETPTPTQAPSSTTNTQPASVDDTQLLHSHQPPENEKMELISGTKPPEKNEKMNFTSGAEVTAMNNIVDDDKGSKGLKLSSLIPSLKVQSVRVMDFTDQTSQAMKKAGGAIQVANPGASQRGLRVRVGPLTSGSTSPSRQTRALAEASGSWVDVGVMNDERCPPWLVRVYAFGLIIRLHVQCNPQASRRSCCMACTQLSRRLFRQRGTLQKRKLAWLKRTLSWTTQKYRRGNSRRKMNLTVRSLSCHSGVRLLLLKR